MQTTQCKHDDFDEYFGKCGDCGADRQAVIADTFKSELQILYGNLQTMLGIESGDIDPLTATQLEAAEDELTNIVSEWLDLAYQDAV